MARFNKIALSQNSKPAIEREIERVRDRLLNDPSVHQRGAENYLVRLQTHLAKRR